ncbi:hypothetical protein BD311DRAFT_754269, partial [Dichomitus squalens]
MRWPRHVLRGGERRPASSVYHIERWNATYDGFRVPGDKQVQTGETVRPCPPPWRSLSHGLPTVRAHDGQMNDATTRVRMYLQRCSSRSTMASLPSLYGDTAGPARACAIQYERRLCRTLSLTSSSPKRSSLALSSLARSGKCSMRRGWSPGYSFVYRDMGIEGSALHQTLTFDGRLLQCPNTDIFRILTS